MNPASERIVINSVSDMWEVDRAQWEATRTRYIFERTGAEARIDCCIDTKREGAPESAWRVDSLSNVAKARVGPDFLDLLREINRQPTALRTAIAGSTGTSGWTRLPAEGDHLELCFASSNGRFEIALAPDRPTSLEGFAPGSVLVLQGAGPLSLVGKWLPDLINHLRLRSQV